MDIPRVDVLVFLGFFGVFLDFLFEVLSIVFLCLNLFCFLFS